MRPKDYRRLESAEEVEEYLRAIPRGSLVAVAVETAAGSESLDLGDEAAVGLSWKPGEARGIPGRHAGLLRPLLEGEEPAKAACDAKAVTLAMHRLGLKPRNMAHDVMLYAFLLDADPAGCSLVEMARRRLDIKLAGAAEAHAACVLELMGKLSADVDTRGMRHLYETIDLPLAGVLARMEGAGIRVDPVELRRLSGHMDGELQRLTIEIHALAGKAFNINSPQQLGKILFEDLNLPAPLRYGKGKVVSTAADVLEELAPLHEIVRKVLDFRQISKLKGTYVDALPELIDAADGRLHTSFNQAGAATGRLSSSNPNLQNIPIRTELGREIRAAFVPREGWRLVVADYSQIELRLLAHMSHDETLVDAFRHNEDIHTRTAAEVFGVGPMGVTPELRRAAKAVNFGIVYGISAFGLAAQLSIPRGEADKYIKAYFARYSGVKRFIEETISEVRRSGVTRTLFGRERPIPDINSKNPNARGFAERTAVNSPLQGTAADLIKLAMIRIDDALREQGLASRMLLQVHDELLFEAPPEEAEALSEMVKQKMEQVCELEVPLVADVGLGANWRDAK
ncbi:MAG: DNA polymerase I, partial [Bryobacteraceae bacterium]